MTKQHSILFAVALFLTIAGFAALIAWAEFGGQDEDINKKLAASSDNPANSLTSDMAKTKSASSASSATGQKAQSPLAQSQPSNAVDSSAGNSALANNSDGNSTNPVSDLTSRESDSEGNQTADSAADQKQTFTSSKLKISFDYTDPDLKVSEATNLLTIAKGDNVAKLKFYSDDKKQDIETWFKDHFKTKDNPSCMFTDPAIKLGSLTSKLIKSNASDDECSDAGNFASSSDNATKVRIDPGKFSTDDLNKILANFKFN